MTKASKSVVLYSTLSVKAITIVHYFCAKLWNYVSFSEKIDTDLLYVTTLDLSKVKMETNSSCSMMVTNLI